MKAFSLDGEGLAINVYNLHRDILIPNAPVKNQCSGDYFYGRDLVIEKELQEIEGEYSKAAFSILQPGYKLNDAHRDVLRSFWLLQSMRTEAASRREVELAAKIDDFVGSESYKLETSIADTIRSAMHRYREARFNFSDMRVCLFRNKTTIPFVTSDDPAVLCNKWHSIDGARAKMSHGLSSAGALFLLPLSPGILCLAYDGDVYSIPNSDGWVEVRHDKDIHSFNQHQYLNCRANIYFRAWEGAAERKHEAAAAIKLRPRARHRLNVAVLESEDHEGRTFRQVDLETARSGQHVLMHMEDLRPHPPSWPRQIKLRRAGRAFRSTTGTGFVRGAQTRLFGGASYHKIRTTT